jgi:ABC-2 type transport system permease protein
MGSDSVFWSLVRQNIHGGKRREPWLQKPWRAVYFTTLFLIFVAASTYAGLTVTSSLDLDFVWFFTFGLPFAAFGNAIAQIVHEWKNGTVGWWLSLPYSRLQLIMAKFVATLIRTIIFFACFYAVISILGVYTIALHGPFSLGIAARFLVSGLKWFGLLLCVCPFAAAFGIFFGVLRESRAKPLLPLFWAAVGLLWWLLTVRGSALLKFKLVNGHWVFFHYSSMMLYPFAASLVIAYVLLYFAAYLLNRQLAL